MAKFREPNRLNGPTLVSQGTKPLASPHNTMVNCTHPYVSLVPLNSVARHDICQHEPPSSLNPFATQDPRDCHGLDPSSRRRPLPSSRRRPRRPLASFLSSRSITSRRPCPSPPSRPCPVLRSPSPHRPSPHRRSSCPSQPSPLWSLLPLFVKRRRLRSLNHSLRRLHHRHRMKTSLTNSISMERTTGQTGGSTVQAGGQEGPARHVTAKHGTHSTAQHEPNTDVAILVCRV